MADSHPFSCARGSWSPIRDVQPTFATLEGTPLITSIVRSSLTGWTVAAGTAETSLVAPLWRSLAKRVRMFGPKVPLSPRLAVILSMILHEIATNAAKYGALSNDTGTVTLDWEIIEESDGPKLRLLWTEAGGPHVTAPPRSGREGGSEILAST